MPNTFYISPLNPFRFTDINAAVNPKYNPSPAIDTGYTQKWQTTDTAYLQIASDFAVTLQVRTCTGRIYETIAVSTPAQQIVGQTFKIYEWLIDFSAFPEDYYYLQVSYSDGIQTYTLQSDLFDVATYHDRTLLYEYTNSRNDKGVIFQTGIRFAFRIEGLIWDYTPGSQNQTYVDQYYNSAQENSITYEKYTNFIGGPVSGLVPDWMLKLINEIYSVDEVAINGRLFARASADEEVKPTRTASLNQNSFAQIDIIPQINFNLGELQTGDTPEGEYRMVQDAKHYNPITGPFEIDGVFKTYSLLVGLNILNVGLNDFTIQIGTTSGGDDIMKSTSVTADIATYLLLNHAFKQATSVFITVDSGVNLDIWVDLKQYDAVSLNPDNPVFAFPKGMEGFWGGSIIEFNNTWDVATGLGKPGTGFDNCQIQDEAAGLYPVIFDRLAYLADMSNSTLAPGAVLGNTDNLLTITKTNLPTDRIGLFKVDVFSGAGGLATETSGVARQSTNSGSDNYIMRTAANSDDPSQYVGLSAPMGQGAPINIQPASIVKVYWRAIS